MRINPKGSTFRVAMAIAATAAVAFAGGVYWTHSAGTVAAAPDAAPADHGWLGMALSPITDAVAARLGIQKQDGLAVVNVVADGPAAKAGVLKADVVKSINGTVVTDLKSAMAKLKDVKPGDTVQLSILRGAATQTISVTAAAAPPRPNHGQPPANGHRGPGGPGHGPGGPGRGAGMAPFSMLPDLQGIAPQDMFDHMLGGSFKFKDKNNNDLTIAMTDGKVVSATDTSVVVKPNRGGANATYGITADTKLRSKGSELKADTKVIVVTKNAATDALAIMFPGQRPGPQGGAKPNAGSGRTSGFEGFGAGGFGGDFGGFLQSGQGMPPQWGQGGFSGGPIAGFRPPARGGMPAEAPASGF